VINRVTPLKTLTQKLLWSSLFSSLRLSHCA